MEDQRRRKEDWVRVGHGVGCLMTCGERFCARASATASANGFQNAGGFDGYIMLACRPQVQAAVLWHRMHARVGTIASHGPRINIVYDRDDYHGTNDTTVQRFARTPSKHACMHAEAIHRVAGTCTHATCAHDHVHS